MDGVPEERFGKRWRSSYQKVVAWIVRRQKTRWFNSCPFHPLVGGHLTPWKGHLTIPKRSLWITRYLFWKKNPAKAAETHGGWPFRWLGSFFSGQLGLLVNLGSFGTCPKGEVKRSAKEAAVGWLVCLVCLLVEKRGLWRRESFDLDVELMRIWLDDSLFLQFSYWSLWLFQNGWSITSHSKIRTQTEEHFEPWRSFWIFTQKFSIQKKATFLLRRNQIFQFCEDGTFLIPKARGSLNL